MKNFNWVRFFGNNVAGVGLISFVSSTAFWQISSLTLLVASLHAFTASNSHAWGQYGHEQINDAAVSLFGTSTRLGQCFNSNRYIMKRYSITPDVEWKADFPLSRLSQADLAKRADNDKYEHSLHFLDADAWVPHAKKGEIASHFPMGEYSQVFPDLKQKVSQNLNYIMEIDPSKRPESPNGLSVNEVVEFGSAPWRILQIYRLAVQALRENNTELALFHLATLGHYVGDITQPFHTSVNYDGQYYLDKNNKVHSLRGIHSATDTRVLPRHGKDTHFVYADFDKTKTPVEEKALALLKKKPALTERLILSEAISLVDDAFLEIPYLLEKYSESNIGGLSDEGKFSIQVREKINAQLAASVAFLVRIWEAAYEEAGRPSMNDCRGFRFNQTLAIQNYPKPTSDSLFGYIVDGFIPQRKKTQ